MDSTAISAIASLSSTRAHLVLGDVAYLRSDYNKARGHFDLAQRLSLNSKDFQGGAQAHWGLAIEPERATRGSLGALRGAMKAIR